MVALRAGCPRSDLYETSDIQPGPGASACAGSVHEGPQQAYLGEAQASVGPVVRRKAGDQDLHLGHQAGERLRRRGRQTGHRLEAAGGDCVVLKPGEELSKDELLGWLGDKVAKWWLPDDVAFIDEVPKTSVGKFSKKDLRDKFEGYQLPTA